MLIILLNKQAPVADLWVSTSNNVPWASAQQQPSWVEQGATQAPWPQPNQSQPAFTPAEQAQTPFQWGN